MERKMEELSVKQWHFSVIRRSSSLFLGGKRVIHSATAPRASSTTARVAWLRNNSGRGGGEVHAREETRGTMGLVLISAASGDGAINTVINTLRAVPVADGRCSSE